MASGAYGVCNVAEHEPAAPPRRASSVTAATTPPPHRRGPASRSVEADDADREGARCPAGADHITQLARHPQAPAVRARAAVPAGGIAGEGVVDGVSVIEDRAHGPVAGAPHPHAHRRPAMRHRIRRGLADREDKAVHRLRPGRRAANRPRTSSRSRGRSIVPETSMAGAVASTGSGRARSGGTRSLSRPPRSHRPFPSPRKPCCANQKNCPARGPLKSSAAWVVLARPSGGTWPSACDATPPIR